MQVETKNEFLIQAFKRQSVESLINGYDTALDLRQDLIDTLITEPFEHYGIGKTPGAFHHYDLKYDFRSSVFISYIQSLIKILGREAILQAVCEAYDRNPQNKVIVHNLFRIFKVIEDNIPFQILPEAESLICNKTQLKTLWLSLFGAGVDPSRPKIDKSQALSERWDRYMSDAEQHSKMLSYISSYFRLDQDNQNGELMDCVLHCSKREEILNRMPTGTRHKSWRAFKAELEKRLFESN